MNSASRVGKLLQHSEPVLTIGVDATVCQAARKMLRHDVGCLLAADRHGTIVGIITERDVVTKAVAARADTETTTVRDVYTPEVISCSSDTPVAKAQELMAQHEIRHLPIFENGKPVGMISSRDILAHQLSSVEGIVRRQSRIIKHLEDQYPGITSVTVDRSGRLVI